MPTTIQFNPEERKLHYRQEGLRDEARWKQYAEQCANVEPAMKTERMTETIRFAEALAAQGFTVVVESWQSQNFSFSVKKEDLPRVYKALGHLEVVSKDVENPRKRLLKVTLKAKDYPEHLRITYEKKLPRGNISDGDEAQKDGEKCKMVKRVTPRKVEYVLQCS